MTAPTQFQLSLGNAIWIDVNTQLGMNNLPDRIPDTQAVIISSLFNLFNCVPGERGRTFQPEYGSRWRQFIHEPVTDQTAAKMQIFMIDAIRRWEPRITLDLTNTSITPDTSLPGFVVRIAFFLPGQTAPTQLQFPVNP
jgi:phage baseplate assembly protein W